MLTAAIEALRAGRMVLLRQPDERYGADLLLAAETVTADAVNFMAKEGRGLIRVALTPERCAELGLRMQAAGAAFTVSVEARSGVTTGISAADRARTIAVAADPAATAADLVQPGHVFPVRAARGGTLEHADQAEAAVDLARLAGLYPAGVLCEVLDADGMVAGPQTLARFRAAHDMVELTAADVARHRRTSVELIDAGDPPSPICGFVPRAFRAGDGTVHLALVRGTVAGASGVLVHVARECLPSTVLASSACGCRARQERAVAAITSAGIGVIVHLRGAPGAHRAPDAADHETAARMLEHLGVRSVRSLDDIAMEGRAA